MKNPFHRYTLAAENVADIEALRIDREQEVNVCSEAIAESRHNVLLYGTRGVGKTFLLRLVRNEITRIDETIFPCIANIASLPEYGVGNDVGAFPRAVLLQLCALLWADLLGRSYLDLRDSLNDTGQEIRLRDRSANTISRVYRHLMLLERTARSAMFNTIGLSVGVKGEKQEEISQQVQHSNILPFEFAEFAHELVSNVLVPKGKKRLVILCDEANQMSIFQQEAILERYLELFSSKRIQFVFVAGMVPWDDKPFLPSCFETRFELQGFADKTHIVELVSKVKSDRPFTDEAVDALVEAFRGHPRRTIEACSMSYYEAAKGDLGEVSASIVLRVIRRLDEESRAHEELMKRQLIHEQREASRSSGA